MITFPPTVLPQCNILDILFFPDFYIAGASRNGDLHHKCTLTAEKRSCFLLSYFAAHLLLQNMTPLLQTWAVPSITEYPVWLLMCQVIFSILLLLSLLINEPSSLFRKSEYIPRILMATFYINCTYLALTIIGTIVAL